MTDLFFCICDHFEPYWNHAKESVARGRISRWVNEYPKHANNHLDSDGNLPKYTFFYPEEEYRKNDMREVEGLCRAGFGEVEIHLHHDGDTPENLRNTLVDYKCRLRGDHGLLSIYEGTKEISYGFIHGNWALDNSSPDGRWCGVNNEIDILRETGCYADFTMPSAPSDTQTRKVNSIYYAVDDPERPKSHDSGINATARRRGTGLLMVQGPLRLDWNRKKMGIFPRIENGGLMGNFGPTMARVRLWVEERIHVANSPSWVFVKVYTHGAQEKVMEMLFDNGGFDTLFSSLEKISTERKIRLHYVSARELVNVIIASENGTKNYVSTNRESPYRQ